MLIVIISLTIILVILCAEFGGNYYSRVKVMRAFFRNKGYPPEKYSELTSIERDLDYESILAHGKFDLYTSNDCFSPQPVIIWVHGGGFVGGDKSCCKSWAPVLAAELKAAVVSINYCLAPEQHYPGPIIQLNETVDYLFRNRRRLNLDTEKIFLAGDSAGAQIVSQYAALACNRPFGDAAKIKPFLERGNLRGIILCCGFYNMDTVLKSHFPAMKTFLWAYTDCKRIAAFERKDELSPVKHVTEDYCDVYITCGNADPFLPQTLEMIEALERAGVNYSAYLPEFSGKRLGHEYQFNIGTAEADVSLGKAVEFIEQRI